LTRREAESLASVISTGFMQFRGIIGRRDW
jgi:hypothetical protein